MIKVWLWGRCDGIGWIIHSRFIKSTWGLITNGVVVFWLWRCDSLCRNGCSFTLTVEEKSDVLEWCVEISNCDSSGLNPSLLPVHYLSFIYPKQCTILISYWFKLIKSPFLKLSKLKSVNFLISEIFKLLFCTQYL